MRKLRQTTLLKAALLNCLLELDYKKKLLNRAWWFGIFFLSQKYPTFWKMAAGTVIRLSGYPLALR